jgi:calmodulin
MMTMPASRESDEYELREAFKCMDLDGNGFISKEELKEMVQKTMQKEIDETEIDEMMDEADLDGDGLIDFDEFVRILVEKRN